MYCKRPSLPRNASLAEIDRKTLVRSLEQLFIGDDNFTAACYDVSPNETSNDRLLFAVSHFIFLLTAKEEQSSHLDKKRSLAHSYFCFQIYI